MKIFPFNFQICIIQPFTLSRNCRTINNIRYWKNVHQTMKSIFQLKCYLIIYLCTYISSHLYFKVHEVQLLGNTIAEFALFSLLVSCDTHEVNQVHKLFFPLIIDLQITDPSGLGWWMILLLHYTLLLMVIMRSNCLASAIP